MKTLRSICLAVCALFFAATASSDEVTIVTNILGPEGPLYLDGNLYYVSWISNTLSKWDGSTITVLNTLPGCSHNGLALTKRKTFLLACTDERGAILELAMTGKQLRRWDADARGKQFAGGINDLQLHNAAAITTYAIRNGLTGGDPVGAPIPLTPLAAASD